MRFEEPRSLQNDTEVYLISQAGYKKVTIQGALNSHKWSLGKAILTVLKITHEFKWGIENYELAIKTNLH